MLERAWELAKDTLPEYNNHGDVLEEHWPRLVEEAPEFQGTLLDGDEPLARIRSVPLRWDGTLEDLPGGIDGAIVRGLDEGGANVLCALLIQVRGDAQSRGLSRVSLEWMVGNARRHGLGAVIAPVRPSWKERYPLVPIERYAAWRREDGTSPAPWPSGRTGSGCRSRRAASTSSRRASRRCGSTAGAISASTGSRTCGCGTGPGSRPAEPSHRRPMPPRRSGK